MTTGVARVRWGAAENESHVAVSSLGDGPCEEGWARWLNGGGGEVQGMRWVMGFGAILESPRWGIADRPKACENKVNGTSKYDG